MRLAYFSPVSPQKTGIADYSERELLPYLSKYFDIDVYIDQRIKPTNSHLINNFNWFSYGKYKKNAHNYDIPLYHMGNNEYHMFIYDSLLKFPGITVLHDIFLHGFVWSQSLAKGNSERYISEFEYCYGDQGGKIARNAIQSGAYPEFTYPLIKRIVDKSLGIICQSEFGAKKVLTEQPNAICTVIPQPFTIDSNTHENEKSEKEQIIQQRWGIENKYPIVISFGYVSVHKRYDVILDIFKKFLEIYPHALWIIIGQDKIGLKNKINELRLNEQVKITGYVSEEILIEIIKISDFCVNLRYPTAGETSRSVLQIMSLGKPVIVSNVGWFSELPNNSCLKVDVDSYQYTVLFELFKLLTEKRKIREVLGKNARDYVIKNHDPEFVAQRYCEFINSILSGEEIIKNKISNSFVNLGLKEYEVESINYQIGKIKNLL
jgi:glycosyltransferase involved in cell wall biosynthesis